MGCNPPGYHDYSFPDASWWQENLSDCDLPMSEDGSGKPERFWNCAAVKIIRGDGDGSTTTTTTSPGSEYNDDDYAGTTTTTTTSTTTAPTTTSTTSTTSTTTTTTTTTTPGDGGGSPSYAAVWAQCGGQNHNGPTECAPGSECVYQSLWYSQCTPLPPTQQEGVANVWDACGGQRHQGPVECAVGSTCVFH